MLERLDFACEDCDRQLGTKEWRLAVETRGGVRHAYECRCGTVTITVVRDQG